MPVLYDLKIPQFLKNVSVCSEHCLDEQTIALVDFYTRTNGPHWLKRKHWNTAKFYCDWEGILCYKRTLHVIAIGLEGNNGMKGYIGNSLWGLPYLLGTGMGGSGLIANINDLLQSFRPFFLRLDFAYNKIDGRFPQNIATKWPCLGKIQLSGNRRLHGSLPKNIDKLKDLQVLSLGETGITGCLPPNIGNLSNLYFLDLETLSMTGDLMYLKGLSNLEYIHFMSNDIDSKIPNDFGNWFPKLVQLSLQGNSLKGIVPASIGNMSKLTLLQLSENRRLTGKIPLSFSSLTNLEIFDISYTQILGFEKDLVLHSSKLSAFVSKGNSKFSMLIYTLVNGLGESKSSLMQLDVQDCDIRGKFDRINDDTNLVNGIFKFSKLAFLNLGGNKRLYGTIPDPISSVRLIMYLNVSYTNLSSALPLSYLIKLKVLQTIDIRGNPMSGTIDQNFMTIDRTVMSTENAADNFTCPTVRLKHNNCIVKADSSYYDRRYCQCNQGYYGQGGYCKQCMKGGSCIRSRPRDMVFTNTTSLSVTFDNYTQTEMKLKRGYWPYPSHNNVSELVKCAWTQPGKELCNPRGDVFCYLNKKNNSLITHCKPEGAICAEGAHGEQCSRCKKGYYKQGLQCYQCPGKQNEKSQIITICIGVAMIVSIGAGLACYSYNKKILAVVLTIFEAVAVFILAAIKIIPSWLAQVNIILILLTIGGLSIGKSFLKIAVFYLQIIDALISSAHIWPPSIYQFEELLSSVINLRFSLLSCHLPKLFTAVGKLVFLMVLPVMIAVIMLCVALIFYIAKGRKDAEMHSKVKNKCAKLTIMFLNLAYFPLVKTVASILAPCRNVGGSSVMTNYVWIECSSDEHHYMTSLAGLATALYAVGIPLLFLCLLVWKRADIGEEDQFTNQWLGSLYNSYKLEYRVGMEVFLLLRRTLLAFLVACLSSHIPLQSALISSVFIVYLAFESHAKPFHVQNPMANPVSLLDKARNLGLENFVEIFTLIVLLVSFITVQSSLQAEYVNEKLLWGIISLNALLSLILVACVLKRMLTGQQNYNILAEDGVPGVDAGQGVLQQQQWNEQQQQNEQQRQNEHQEQQNQHQPQEQQPQQQRGQDGQ